MRILAAAFFAWIFGALYGAIVMLFHMIVCSSVGRGVEPGDEAATFFKVAALVVELHSFLFGRPYPVLPFF